MWCTCQTTLLQVPECAINGLLENVLLISWGSCVSPEREVIRIESVLKVGDGRKLGWELKKGYVKKERRDYRTLWCSFRRSRERVRLEGANTKRCGAVLEKGPDEVVCGLPAIGCLQSLEYCGMRDIVKCSLYI